MSDSLRSKAEGLAKDSISSTNDILSPEDTEQLLNELRVHQAELEMQNEELLGAQAKLEASQAEYQDLYDFAPVGYLTLNEQGLIHSVNLTAAALLGMPRGMLILQPIASIIHNDDQDILYRHRNELLENGLPQSCDLRMTRQDGSTFWANMSITARNAFNGTTEHRIVIIDVSQRKRDEEALRESEQRFQQLLQTIPTVSVQGYFADGKVIYWNEASERLYGYTQQEALGRNIVDLIIPPGMRDEVRAAIRTMSETGAPLPSAECELMRKDGSLAPVFSSHAVIQVPGVGPELYCMDFDLTEQKQAQKALRESEEKFRILAEFTYDWETWIGPEGELLHISPSCERITGYTAQEFISNPSLLDAIVHVDDRESYRAHTESTLDTDQIGILEYRIVTKDGRIRWLSHCCQAVSDSQGKRLGRRGSNRDVTERKQAEQFREHVERIIRHDIKSPLIGLHGLASLALDDKLDEDFRALIPGLMHSIRNVINLVDSSEKILMMERSEYIPQSKWFDLRDVFRDLEISLNSLTQARRVRLVWGGLFDPVAYGEEFLIEDMLLNLVKNAVEASPERSDVAISCRIAQDLLRVEIHNQGVVPESIRNRFFDKYVTAGKSHGTGLGTYSAQLIAKAHGGHIEFSSSMPKGTTVAVILPHPRTQGEIHASLG